MGAKKLNKFINLSKELVKFESYSTEKKEEFVSNAIAIYRNNHLENGVVNRTVAKFFIGLIIAEY